jgi:hypothetical protein
MAGHFILYSQLEDGTFIESYKYRSPIAVGTNYGQTEQTQVQIMLCRTASTLAIVRASNDAHCMKFHDALRARRLRPSARSLRSIATRALQRRNSREGVLPILSMRSLHLGVASGALRRMIWCAAGSRRGFTKQSRSRSHWSSSIREQLGPALATLSFRTPSSGALRPSQTSSWPWWTFSAHFLPGRCRKESA